jgi:hypothetical protein
VTRFVLAIALGLILASCAQALETPAPASTRPAPTATPRPTDQPTTVPPSATAPIRVAASPEPSLPAPRLFGRDSFYGEDPVILHGSAGSWDAWAAWPGAVVIHDGTYTMFRKALHSSGLQAQTAVVLSTSLDGYTWQSAGEEPLFTDLGLDLTPFGLVPFSALVDRAGQWVLYFSAIPDGESTNSIFRATAPAAAGPWAADPEPVLVAGPDDSWDEGGVDAPNVIQRDQTYYMYYNSHRSRLPDDRPCHVAGWDPLTKYPDQS